MTAKENARKVPKFIDYFIYRDFNWLINSELNMENRIMKKKKELKGTTTKQEEATDRSNDS